MARHSISGRWVHPYEDETDAADTVPPAMDPADASRTSLQSDRNFRTILETLPDGILVLDGAGVVRYANPSAARLFDARVESIVGRQFGAALAVNTTVELKPSQDRRLEMRVESTVWQDEPAFLAVLTDLTAKRHASRRCSDTTERAADVVRQAGRACARLRQGVGADERLTAEIDALEQALGLLRDLSA